MRQIIIPDNEQHWLELRKKVLTSTDIPSLFNAGYVSYDELLEAKKTGISPEFKTNERVSWGNYLQDGIARKFADDNKWNMEKMNEFIFDDQTKIGASFDYRIKLDNGEFEIAEVKNVAYEVYKNNWIQGFEIQSTPYIEFQVQAQLLVSGYKTAYICALIAGNQGICLRREANKKVQDAILTKAKKFWEEVYASKT